MGTSRPSTTVELGMTRAPRSRRLILVGAIAVLGLSACGEAGSTASPTASDAPSTTVTTSAHTPAVIRLGAQSGAGTAAASPMTQSEGDVDSSTIDSKMRAMNLVYEYQGTPRVLPESAAAWYFPGDRQATKEQVAALATALGITGDVVALPADQGGGWMVGPSDYTGPTVNVSADGMQSWWYGGGATVSSAPCEDLVGMDGTGGSDTDVAPAAPDAAPDAATSEIAPAPATSEMVADPNGTDVDPSVIEGSIPPCIEVSPPAGVPTQAAAEDLAKQFFAGIGMDTASYEYETYVDEWSASVTAYLVLDGVRTSVTANVGFGENAAITWAGGFFGSPVRGDEYPLIGVEGGVDRLNEQSASWATLERGVATDAATDVVASEAAPPDVTDIATDPVPAGVPTDVPTDQEPIQQETVVVTFIDVHPSLEQVWAEDGTVWLLPGYKFDSNDGGWYSVTAVEDQYLQQADPADEPLTVAPGEAPVDATGPATPDSVVQPAAGPATDPGAQCGTVVTINTFDAAQLDVSDVSFLVGLCLEDAVTTADGLGISVRVIREDGVDLDQTADLDDHRVNVATKDGIVSEILSIG